MAKKLFTKRTLALLLTIVMCFSSVQMAANAATTDTGNWSYAYYLGQEYLGNAAGKPVKPDPVGYGFQGVITSITFTDDAGTTWTFNWNSEANGEWRITGKNASKTKASAWPKITDGKIYVGYCGNKAYTFTLGNEGSSESWTYANTQSRHANWFRYIRFIREYTVNVFYENETGSVIFNGETFTQAEPVIGTFYFQYPNGGIIDDSEYEDGEYTVPTTLMPEDYLPASMIQQGYEIKYATDAKGRDVLTSGVTISLLGDNILNVYCTLIPPVTENYSVVHNYYMDGTFEGTRDGGAIEVTQGSNFADVVAGITKLTDYNGNTYDYISYEVDPAAKVITLTYTRARPTYDYTVTYNANFGENPATVADGENVTGVYDTAYTITADACAFDRENYYFAGWNTAPDGTGKDYDADDALELTAENNSLVLYAQWQMKPRYDYIVTYNANFGENPATASDSENVIQTFKTTRTITVDENMFQRDHYDFLGWATEKGGEVVYLPGMKLNFTEGGKMELFAVWREHNKYRYALSYNGNGGALSDGLVLYADEENVQSVYDTSYTIGVNTNTFSREHYTFIGWNTKPSGNGTAYAPGDEVKLTAANNTLTLYAQWAEHPKYDYTVTYSANFGLIPETKADAQSIFGTYSTSHQVNVDANTFVRENYTFAGWNTKPNGTGVSYAADEVLKLTASDNTKVLYAQWIENPRYDYTVTYNAGFGATPATAADSENVTRVFDESYRITVDANGFTRANYTFVGWATEKNGKVVYTPGDVISFEKGGSEELFAIWQEHNKYNYTVIYNGNGGALLSGEKAYGDSENIADTYATSHTVTVDGNTFRRDHYDFVGWNTSPDGIGISYSAQDALALTASKNAMTLYAQWAEHEKYDYTVIYNEGYGEDPKIVPDSENESGTYDPEKDITVDDNPFVRENYEFEGWSTEPGGEVVYEPGDEISFTEGGEVELYAVWEEFAKYDYRLTYMGNGGALADNKVSYNDAESVSQVYDTTRTMEVDGNFFARKHYDFLGWNTRADGAGAAYNPGSSMKLTAANNTGVLYAQWREHQKYDYTVTYNANFGANPATAPDAENVTGVYETTYTVNTDGNSFNRPNYTFVGWNTQADGSGTAYAYGAPIGLTAANNYVTLYAQWVENPKYDYTVTYSANFGEIPAVLADAENVSGVYESVFTMTTDRNSFNRPNYTFLGWNTAPDGSGDAYISGQSIRLTAEDNSLTLYAQWEEHAKYDYSVTYNAGYGLFPATAPDAENAVQIYDETYSIEVDENTFRRANHDFVGWATEKGGEVRFLAGDVISFEKGGSEELFAIWQEHNKYSYTVIYNGNGGLLPDMAVSYGDLENVTDTYATTHTATVDGNAFGRDHYDFVGWNTSPDGTGTAYTPEQVLKLTAENNTVTLYAQWQEHEKYDYSVIYNANHGETPATAEDSENVTGTYETVKTFTVDENIFSREHYDFLGWNTSPDGTGTAYTPEQILELTAENNSLTLYAQWEEHEKYDYEVIYYPNNGDDTDPVEDSENETDTYDPEKTITVDDNPFVSENDDFIGWSTEPDGEVVYKPGDEIDFTEGGKTELYAQWEPKDREYTVVYLVQIDDKPYVPFDGEVPAGGTLPHGTVVGKDIVNPPARITDGTYTYEIVRIDEIVLGEGENVVKVFFRYVTPPVTEDPIPEDPTPEEPVPTDPTPEDPVPTDPAEPTQPAEPATVDGDGLVDLPDEDVPLAEVPHTGDPMLVYAGMTLLSGAGLAYLGLGKKKEEED